MDLENGLGIWQIISSSQVTDIISRSGFDLTILDLEHGLHSPESVQNCVFAARSNNLISIARLPSIEYPYLNQIVDSGVDGLLFPHIETESDLKNVIQKALLFPNGNRSFSPFVPRFSYGRKLDLNIRNPSIGILIESKIGLECSETLIGNTYVDFIYFGAYDISVEFNCPGDIYAKKVINELKMLTSLAKQNNKKVAAIYRNKEELNLLNEIGVQFPIFSVDTSIILESLSNQVSNYKNLT